MEQRCTDCSIPRFILQLEYHPSPEDMTWAKRTISLLQEGGSIIIPCNQTIYKVHQKYMRIDRVAKPNNVNLDPVHLKNIVVFGVLGYYVND